MYWKSKKKLISGQELKQVLLIYLDYYMNYHSQEL